MKGYSTDVVLGNQTCLGLLLWETLVNASSFFSAINTSQLQVFVLLYDMIYVECISSDLRVEKYIRNLCYEQRKSRCLLFRIYQL